MGVSLPGSMGRRTWAAACGAVVAMTDPAVAQDETPDMRGTIRIEVTGSHIARTEEETALPVQVITREEILRAGFTTAAELISRLPAAFNGMNSQLSVGNAGSPGLNSANLRGLGDGNTLVLMNGRRLANYAFLSGTVDLGSIPLAAIERVEILKDGASSVYGTDAIAGVVNFILRKDFTGVEVSGQAGITQHGGTDHYQGTVTAGWGDLARDRFNAFVAVDWQKDTALAARDRPFAHNPYVPEEGVNALNIVTFPANIRIGPGRFLNPTAASGCAPPSSLPLPPFASEHARNACGFNAWNFIDIVPREERTSVLARATWQFARDHQAFAEYVHTDNKLALRVAPTPVNRFGNPDAIPVLYPASGPYYPADFASANGLAGDIEVFVRTVPLGPRADDIRTRADRLIVGLEGNLGRWTYNTAYNHSENRSTDTFGGGWVYTSKIIPAFATGLINPFGASGPEGDALLASTQFSGEVRSARGQMDQLDVRVSGDLLPLPGGPLAMAFGGEARRERLIDSPAPILASGDLMSQPGSISGEDASRRVQAAFLEFDVPIVKALEALLSVRYDHYSDFGGTTNPKIALRWQPVKSLLVRGSWGKGFRAPSLPDLFLPQAGTTTIGDADPVRCPVTEALEDCGGGEYAVRYGGNRALQPELSEQWTAGIVWEPVIGVSVGMDYWNIRKTNVIGALDNPTILEHLEVFGANVIRGPADPAFPGLPGPIQTLIEWNQNLGDQRTSGIDFDLRASPPATSFGRFGASFAATYVIDWTNHLRGLEAEDFVGRYHFAPIPRWRHYLQLGWERGPWSATLAQSYQTGYTDAGLNGEKRPRRVGSYEVWDLQAQYAGFRNTTITAGIRNLFDRAPPFTNQGATFQIGYDPNYADPRGRTYYARVSYAFK